MNEGADGDDFGWKFEPSEHEIGDDWTDDELDEGDDNKAPFGEDMLEVGTREHEADANDGEWSGGATDVADGVGDEAR